MTQASPQANTAIEQETPQEPVVPFDMKAGQFTLPTLLVRHNDTDALDKYLGEQVAKLPNFFDQAPLVLDLSQYESDNPIADFAMIIGMVRGHGMIPVGLRSATEALIEQARMLELAIMPKARIQKSQPRAKATATQATEKPAVARSMIIDKPVRSGQRIYAEGADLVLLGGVSSGAEVMADGNVHAYGAIRGRVMAGVRNNPEARIFCQDMGAELVAIAGSYRVSDDIPTRHLGHAVQISLIGNSLKFESL